MKRAPDTLTVGVTAWNSGMFLPLCLQSVRETVPHAHITVLDNRSTDNTVSIAREFGAQVLSANCSQAEALDRLARSSRAQYTLLIHADVVMLSQEWWPLVRGQLEAGHALVSPEDIGCGPYTRPWGKGMPESSFMCFRTQVFPQLRTLRWYRRARVPFFRRHVDFFGDHVTYNLPGRLARAGLTWRAMEVHTSSLLAQPYYTPEWQPQHWRDDLGRLDYGLGNFYSLDGVITHYHNWYDRRVEQTGHHGPRDTLEMNGAGVPTAYLKAYSERFVADYRRGEVRLPRVEERHGPR